jgi:preprotein translocase subunit YajC
VNFALPLLLFVVVYMLVILPQSRRRKQAAALQRAVEPGSKVLLHSGLYGTVVEIDDAAVILEVAEGVHLRYAKAAVLRVVPDPVDVDYDEEEADADEDADYDADAGGHDAADAGEAGIADHDGDTVARPSNREPSNREPSNREPSNRAEPDDPEAHGGNDAGAGPVPKS